ncbi:hypothetical protein GSF22_09300 [Micromonospora echinofusca]|uniref:Uncharacterized protein n=1 Tax=Micromonospora echinofusca TaxID=47858 RepID=A0ABS3VNX8_MICEH|nr:hypothetical protein [Micromonospora echinofusca]
MAGWACYDQNNVVTSCEAYVAIGSTRGLHLGVHLTVEVTGETGEAAVYEDVVMSARIAGMACGSIDP